MHYFDSPNYTLIIFSCRLLGTHILPHIYKQYVCIQDYLLYKLAASFVLFCPPSILFIFSRNASGTPDTHTNYSFCDFQLI